MKVSRAKAEKNREHVVDVASRLFREKGFDGIGLNGLMEGAGLTHGAFYGQFPSKEDLTVHASRHAFAESIDKWTTVLEKADGDPLAALMRFYLSSEHAALTGEGCPLAALGPDAARRSSIVREAFQDGIARELDILSKIVETRPGEDVRDKAMATLSTMVGALVLSRLTGNKVTSRRILDSATKAVTRPDRTLSTKPRR